MWYCGGGLNKSSGFGDTAQAAYITYIKGDVGSVNALMAMLTEP